MLEKSMIAVIVGGGSVCLVMLAGLFTSLIIWMGGWYHYDYRCWDGVVEQQYQTMGRGWGGWNPVSNVNIPCEDVP